MKMKILIWMLPAFCFLQLGCQKDIKKPLVDNGAVPGQVVVQRVENQPGAARIYYTVPADPNILYIKALYRLEDGKEMIVKASTYSNYVELNGFGEVGDKDVKLIAVSRSEKESAPVSVTVSPLLARVHEVFKTLHVQATFGGVNITFHNEEGLEYVLHTMIKNTEGAWVQIDRLYSKSVNRSYAVRNLESKPTEMAFFFTDQWNNPSDTLLANLTPLYEEALNKNLWKKVSLFNDTNVPEFGDWAFENLWDGTTARFFYAHSNPPSGGLVLPNWFTIDLGQKSVFSRIRVNQLSHNNAWMFAAGAPRLFEIWGSNEPAPDGSWDSWTLLSSFESVKPSGRPLGDLSNEDIAVATAGEDFTFPVGIEGYRYIRLKTNKTWGGYTNVMIAELTMWGQPVN